VSGNRQSVTRLMAVFASGTLLSRLLGLVRDVVVADAIPFVSREIFFFAFRFPNMLRDMLGEGAVNAAYVPLFSRSLETEGEAAFRRVARACFGATLILFAVLTVAGIGLAAFLPGAMRLLQPFTGQAAPEIAHLEMAQGVTAWLMPYLLLIGAAVFAMGPLFVVRHYSTPSWSPVILNIALVGSCFVAKDWFPDPVWALVAGVWLGGIGQAVVMILAMKRHAGIAFPSLELRHPGVRKAMLLLIPVVIGQATGEVNKLVDASFAFKLEAVSYLYYANRLVQLPLSIFGIAVAVAILPAISAAGARNDHEEVRGTLLHGFRQSAFLVLPAMAGLLVLGEPIMRLLFAHRGGEFSPEEAHNAAAALFYYAWGLLAFAWVKVGVQGFFAVHETKTPVIVASASMGLNIVLNMALVGPMGFRGLALATTISYAFNAIGLYVLLGRRYGTLYSAEFLMGLGKIITATGGMAAAAYGIYRALATVLPGDHWIVELVHVLIPVLASLVLYPALCAILKLEDIALLRRLLRGRRAA
jgi:putative peptidoglycan lipid II flippase